MERIKTWGVVLMAGAIAVSAAACGKSSGGIDKPAGSSTPATLGSTGPVDLTITSSGATDEAAFEQNYGSFIKKKFPNYNITYIKKVPDSTTIDKLIAAGTKIDLIYETIGGMSDGLIKPGLATDISDLVKKHNIDLNRFEPSLIDGMHSVADGKLYGLPVNNLIMNLYYNKDLFDKFGVSYPKDGMTWDDAVALARKLDRKDGGTQYLGLGVSSTHILRMNQYSLPYVDDKTGKSTFGNEKWKTILTTIFKGEADNSGYRDYMQSIKGKIPYKDEFLKNKNMAMFGYFTDLPITYPEMKDINWDVAALPTFKDAPKIGSQPYPTYWNVVSTSTHKDEAMNVITYLTSDEFQTILSKRGELTTLKNPEVQKEYGADYPRKGIHWSAAFYNQPAKIPAKTLYDTVAEKPLTDLVNKVADQSIDINTALSQAQEAADKAIATEKSK